MRVVIASANRGKIAEFQQLIKSPIVPFYELIDEIEIIEDGSSFAQNALIKAKTIYNHLKDDSIVIADDSGISIDILDGKPGIYSARFAGENASDLENLQKVIDALNEKNVNQSKAHYTAAIALVSKFGEYVVHGWMHGKVINTPRGTKGFGYDPIFIPNGFTKTLGELDESIKSQISHRSQALKLIEPIITMLKGKL